MDAEPHVTNSGGATNNEKQEPQTRKRFLHIHPNVPLPFLASLFPCLRHRANTAASPLTPPSAPSPAPPDPPAPAVPPVTPPPAPTASTRTSSNDVLMSVEDFSRFVDAAEDLLKPVPQLWQRFIDLLESFLPQSPAAAEG